jgi:phosphate:Na+ symporter
LVIVTVAEIPMKEILILLTGITFFLFGMLKLSAEVQQLFTVRIRDYIKYAVKKPVYGLFVGTVSTVFFQSSSATSVLIIGMVNAGLITFYQSLAIILGSDIGTTLTVQLVVWKFTDLSPFFIISGAMLWFMGKAKWKTGGELVFYFGLIFFGLSLTSYATAPLKNHPAVIYFFQESKHPLIGIMIGALLAGAVHASAIPISILVILAQYNLVTIENALPIVFGANLGTTITALMASMVTSISGKRSAVSHLLFKSTGVLTSMAILPYFIEVLNILTVNTAQQIAFGHLIFNVIIVILFIFILTPYSRMVEKMIPGEEEVLPLWPEFLDDKHLTNSEEALNCVKKEMHREIVLAEKIFRESLILKENYQEWRRQSIGYIESVVDNLCIEIMDFLCRISHDRLSPEQSRRLFTFTAMVDDIERIADHAVRLAELSKSEYLTHSEFTKMARDELAEIERLVTENLRDAISLISCRDEKMISNVFSRESEIDKMVKVARESHLIRYYCGICHADAGPFFVETLLHLERISDLCQNVAEYVDDLHEN